MKQCHFAFRFQARFRTPCSCSTLGSEGRHHQWMSIVPFDGFDSEDFWGLTENHDLPSLHQNPHEGSYLGWPKRFVRIVHNSHDREKTSTNILQRLRDSHQQNVGKHVESFNINNQSERTACLSELVTCLSELLTCLFDGPLPVWLFARIVSPLPVWRLVVMAPLALIAPCHGPCLYGQLSVWPPARKAPCPSVRWPRPRVGPESSWIVTIYLSWKALIDY